MNNFNYFFTPVGPEYKKKFARNVGVVVLILFAFYGVASLISNVSEPKEIEMIDDVSSIPEPERNPVPEGTYDDKNMYVYSVEQAESLLDFKLSTPYVPQGIDLEKIKISNDKRKATLFYSNGLQVAHHPMGINFNNTHYVENPEREEGKIFYNFDGTFAEGLQVTDPFYSVITVHRSDRIYVKATMDTGLDELLKMIEPMDFKSPHVPYTPTLDYVMDGPEPEPIPEPEPEYPEIPQNDMYCWTEWYLEKTVISESDLISSIQKTIAEFGSNVDVPNREITIFHNEEETVISVAGIWIKDQTQHKELTAVVKNYVDNSKIIRDDIISCR